MMNPTPRHARRMQELLAAIGAHLPEAGHGPELSARTPIDGSELCRLRGDTPQDAARRIEQAQQRFASWRDLPAPRRGEAVRRFGDLVRQHKAVLGEIVSIEAGKITQEGLGEVQEVVDICEFALGLSRQLHGLTIASERPEHKLLETWHPLGVVGVISAFNFPVAVWAWNASLALVCGNTAVWKPSEKGLLSAVAIHHLMQQALADVGEQAPGVSELLIGEREVGAALVAHPAVRLVSATGSTAMGRAVGVACAQHFKRALLELGGNNALIVAASADIDMALRAITFSAAGTAGQRCTSLRRLFVHESVYPALVQRLRATFERLAVGNPLQEGTLVGPLIDGRAFEQMQAALQRAREAGAAVHFGERVGTGGEGAFYVRPAIVEMKRQGGPMLEETFAPILYVTPFTDFDAAIALNNASVHGLSSAVFTLNLREAERFTSARGSDCGIANVNIGTSGAEIGGAFGGEKETGGGRESGSDSWKAYMRRATNTINYGSGLPLAQGIKFDV
jgi:aldehyde dehydrogenase (NAD+)